MPLIKRFPAFAGYALLLLDKERSNAESYAWY